jgi:hypothetical protein
MAALAVVAAVVACSADAARCAATEAAGGTTALPRFEDWVLGGAASSATFFSTAWQAEPLLLRNLTSGPRVGYNDIEVAMEAARGRRRLVGKMAIGGKAILRDAELSEQRIRRGFLDGASLTVGTPVCLLNAQLARAARAVEMATGVNTEANVYWSANAATTASGFRPHWDSQDVFVLQLQGAKSWQVFGHGGKELPFEADKPADWPREHGGQDAIMDVTLRAGDVLYVPRGYTHSVRPLPGEPSLHVSLTAMTEGFAFSHLLHFAVDPKRCVAAEVTRLPATTGRVGRPLVAPVTPGCRLSRAALFGALLDHLASVDVGFRRSALPACASTAEHVQLLVQRWVDSVSGPFARQLLQRAGAQCDSKCVTELQGVLRDTMEATTAGGLRRLLQELELRFFEGVRHFGAPPAPSSCALQRKPGAPAMDTLLHRNQHTPALAVMLYSTDEVALFAEDFAMDVYPSAVAAALEQALSASTPFRVRDLPLGSAAKAKDVLQLARHLVERGVCCRLN